MVSPAQVVAQVGSWQRACGGVCLGYAFGGDDELGFSAPSLGNLRLEGANGEIRVGHRWQRNKWVVGPERSLIACGSPATGPRPECGCGPVPAGYLLGISTALAETSEAPAGRSMAQRDGVAEMPRSLPVSWGQGYIRLVNSLLTVGRSKPTV